MMTTSEDQPQPGAQPDSTSASAGSGREEGATLGLTGEPNTFEPEEEAGPEPSDGTDG